jgi:hypothetical protein
MKIFNIIILVIFFVYSCFQCSDDKLKINNSSNKNILVYYYQTAEISKDAVGVQEIKAYTIESLQTVNRKKWEYVFEEAEDHIIRFYFYDGSLLSNKTLAESFKTRKNNKLVLKKYELTKKDLDKMNWVINFP